MMRKITTKTVVKSVLMACLISGISAGTVWGDNVPVVTNVTYDGYITHVSTYNGISEQSNGGVYVGALKNVSNTFYLQRSVFKWDLSSITENVSSATISFYVNYSGLTGSLAGDITISTFTTASNGAVVGTDGGWDGSTPIAPTASKVAFASDQPNGATVTVDVTEWLNNAIDADMPYFSVRLSADYLTSSMLPENTTSNPICWIYASESGSNKPATLTTVAVPEPATMALLGLGSITWIIRRRRQAM